MVTWWHQKHFHLHIIPWLLHFENISSREMRGRLFVISEAGSDGTNTSQTATYKCLVSASQGAAQSPAYTQQWMLNLEQNASFGFLSPGRCQLTEMSETNFSSFDAIQSPSFCLLAHDWWWDRSVFNQWYLEPLKSWNEKYFIVKNNFNLGTTEWKIPEKILIFGL